MFEEIYRVARFGLRLLPKLFGNFGDFANRRTQKSLVCVSDTQALQANKVAIVFYAHSLFLGDLCRIYVIYDYEAVSYRTSWTPQLSQRTSKSLSSQSPLPAPSTSQQPAPPGVGHPPKKHPQMQPPTSPHTPCVGGCSCNVSGQRLMGKIRLDLGPSVNTELHGLFVPKYNTNINTNKCINIYPH